MRLYPNNLYISLISFRDCPDDGALTGLSFAPLISIALLFSSLRQSALANPTSLPPDWLIEAPQILEHAHAPLSALDALILSRRSLVDYATLCSFILLAQIFSSSWYEARFRRARNMPEGERGSVPRSEARRTWTYWTYSYVLTLVVLFVRHLLASNNINLWQSEYSPTVRIRSSYPSGQILAISISSWAPCSFSSVYMSLYDWLMEVSPLVSLRLYALVDYLWVRSYSTSREQG